MRKVLLNLVCRLGSILYHNSELTAVGSTNEIAKSNHRDQLKNSLIIYEITNRREVQICFLQKSNTRFKSMERDQNEL